MNRKVFGKLPSGERLNRILLSPNFKNGAFQNIEPTDVNPNKVSIGKLILDFYNKPKSVVPGRELTFVKTDLNNLAFDQPSVIWFGHSSYLITYKGFTILVDPVFSGYASPVKLFGKSFLGSDNYRVEDFPTIDLLIITHDHYDHLDYETIAKIKGKVKMALTPLGVGAHLEYWGVDKNKIAELDWWEKCTIQTDVEITATPSRHFSGRGISRAKSLWASFVLKIHGRKIFIGGDSGYDKQFKIIGERYNGFDLALIECGQYGVNWPQIHMTPEETVMAAKDLNTKILFPVHWAKFALSTHAWNEPVNRLIVAAQKENVKLVTPKMGQPFFLEQEHQPMEWWNLD